MVRVLWIANVVLPDFAEYLNVPTPSSGTWMIDLLDQLAKEDGIEIAVACVHGKSFVQKEIKGVTYFAIPGNGKTMMFYHANLVKYWDMIEQAFNPDLVHIHGTEYTHSISYLRKYPSKKYLLTIQGVISKVAEHYTDGLSAWDLLSNRTLHENLSLSGIIEKKIVRKKGVKFEREIIQKVHYATGRTVWDRAIIESINPDIKYYQCNYNLRDEFYRAEKWSLKTSNRNQIYVSTAAQLPLKGGHEVLKAIKIVAEKVPQVEFVFIANKASDGKIVPTSGYAKLISKRVKELGIQDNVRFVGRLKTNDVIDIMQQSRICIIPSAVENASATMREAMHIGTPLIASFRGGMINLIQDGISGFYYDYTESEYLAARIVQLLEDDNLAQSFSEHEIERAEDMHNRQRNKEAFVQIYRDICSSI